MCTLAWNVSGDGLWVCFNRDERRDRPRAEPPKVDSSGRYPVAYARDPEGGGSWLAVSAAGFIVAVMNNYTEKFPPGDNLVSRGKLVLSSARENSFPQAREKVHEAVESGRFAPFFLFLLSASEQLMLLWNGRCLVSSKSCPEFWTTSSFETAQVFEWRKRIWEKQAIAGNISLADAVAVLKQRNGDSAYCMTMDRPDARTVSQSTIRLNREGMEFRYAERQPAGAGYQKAVACCW